MKKSLDWPMFALQKTQTVRLLGLLGCQAVALLVAVVIDVDDCQLRHLHIC